MSAIDYAMDKLTQYRESVQKVLLDYVQAHPTQADDLELQPIFDQERGAFGSALLLAINSSV